uniref:Uncharacterized protein n=1 Tax=Amphimedon queenslandica TaxID=400682 RepID=A0A1X7TJ11_AMPQE
MDGLTALDSLLSMSSEVTSRVSTKASQKLTKNIVDKRFCNAVKQLSPIHRTSNLEAFHSIILRFAPKLIAFSYNRMLTRQKLVAIHYIMKPTADSEVKLKLAKRYCQYPVQSTNRVDTLFGK